MNAAHQFAAAVLLLIAIGSIGLMVYVWMMRDK